MKRTVKSRLIIIPNEEELPVPIFDEEVDENIRHGKRVKEFSDNNHLGLNFQNLGLEEGNYNGYIWCVAMCSLGHMCVQIDEDTVIYIPHYISDNQVLWYERCFINTITNKKNVHAISIRNTGAEYKLAEITSTKEGDETLTKITSEIHMKKILTQLRKRTSANNKMSK